VSRWWIAGILLLPACASIKETTSVTAVIAGEVVDLITDIPPAAEIIERIVTSATRLLAGASNKYRITESQ
jgi:nitronate monooxygenase